MTRSVQERAVQFELYSNYPLSLLNVEKRRSSTFSILHKGYNSRRVLSAVVERVPEITAHNLTEADWSLCRKIAEFLEHAAKPTEE